MNEPAGQSPLGGAQQPMQSKTPFIAPWLLIVSIIVLLAGGGYLGWWYYSTHKTAAPTTTTTTPTTTTTTPTSTATSTADWKTIANTKYSYSIKYPTDWYVYGYKTGDEPTTATLHIALKNAQSDSHYIKVSTGNDTEMEAIITSAASKTGYQTSATTLDGQTATQYSWTEVLDGKNVSAIKLVKVTKGDYTYYLYGIVTDYNKTATIDQGNFAEILATFQFTSASTTPVVTP